MTALLISRLLMCVCCGQRCFGIAAVPAAATATAAALLLPPYCCCQAVDFSRDILSLMQGELKIMAYPFHGYWEDVGSLKDYYAANMAMAADVSGHNGVNDIPCPVKRSSVSLPSHFYCHTDALNALSF
jgi:hypothetical protein